MTTTNKKFDEWGIRTPEQTRADFPVGTVVAFVRYDDHVHGVGFEPGDRLEVVGYSTDCGNDGLRVRRVSDSVSDLVFSTEVRIPARTATFDSSGALALALARVSGLAAQVSGIAVDVDRELSELRRRAGDAVDTDDLRSAWIEGFVSPLGVS